MLMSLPTQPNFNAPAESMTHQLHCQWFYSTLFGVVMRQ